MNRHHPVIAVAMTVLSALLLAMMDAGTKYLGGMVSIIILLWTRYTFQAGAMAAWVQLDRGMGGFRTAHLPLQILRGGMQLAMTTLAILSLRHIPLADFTAIVMLSPLVVTALSSRMSDQRVGRLRWVLVWAGFVGTVVVIRPGSGMFGVHVVLPLMTMAVLVAYSLLTSRLALLENPVTTHFYSGLTASLAAVPLLLLHGESLLMEVRNLPAMHLAMILAIAMLSTGGHLLLVMAFGRARATTLMPFTYMQIGFAGLLGWIFFHDTPDFWAWTGMVMIAASGGTTAWLNLRLPKRVS